MSETNTTIAALATANGAGAIAMIRVSGSLVTTVISRHLQPSDPQSWKMYHGCFRKDEKTIDSVNFVYQKSPRSYTGEDCLEISCHGNHLIVQEILNAIFSHENIIPASPGEFTRRALENGKMDLIQAEAVGQLAQARTKAAVQNAQKQLQGELSQPLQELKERLTELSVRLELDVDFAEEEADPDYSSWKVRLQEINAWLNQLINGWERGKKLAHEPKVALYGAPNAGKSSLINALLGKQRLLVSPIAGTTRDYVEVPLALPGGEVILVDTAGLGNAVDELDAMAMERTRTFLKEADYRILVMDGRLEAQPKGVTNPMPELVIRTRADDPSFQPDNHSFSVSNLTGSGLRQLLEHMNRELFPSEGSEEPLWIASKRQLDALIQAKNRIQAAVDSLEARPEVEIIAFEVRQALDNLREILGEVKPDEVLNRIFSGFCIGK